jgi:radical SAM protein with 4Fe4S-binding SPASM domain
MRNPLVHMLEIGQLPAWERLKQERIPLAFTLEITARCNNNCRHCYINLPAADSHAKSEELTLSEILGIAGQAVEMGAVWCLVTGGEPLLRPDFPDIYLALKRMGLLMSVFTNATLIQEVHVDLFKRYPPRNLEVTVYGITQATYEAVTGHSGSFAAFRRGLGLLLENNVRVSLKAMALRSNLHELPQIAEFCRRHTKGYYRFDPLLHLRYDRNPGRNAQIRDERLTPEEIVFLEQSDPERFTAMQKHCDELLASETSAIGDNRLFHCGAGIGEFAVSYNGLFRLCESLWAPGTTYDLRKGTLRQAWFDFVPHVRDLHSRKPAFQQTCQVCPIINLCLSCPGHTHMETGEMDGETPYFCAVAHARASTLEESKECKSNIPCGQTAKGH